MTILQLQRDQQEDQTQMELEPTLHLLDHEILDYATQHDLAIFVSIDGSLDSTGVATTTISVIAPDIRETDSRQACEWQHRIAKVLLI